MGKAINLINNFKIDKIIFNYGKYNVLEKEKNAKQIKCDIIVIRRYKMLPFGYNPENYGGKVWWNDKNPKMREIWGTQEDYDNFKKNGGTWEQYEQIVKNKLASKEIQPSNNSNIETEKVSTKTR